MGEQRRTTVQNFYYKMNNSGPLLCIRSGLVMIIPVLLIGSMALMLKSFPIDAYQSFINNFLGGIIDTFFGLIYQSTFGVLSLYIVASISISYTQQVSHDNRHILGPVIASLIAFLIISGTMDGGSINIAGLGTSGMFIAVACSLLVSHLYDFVNKKMKRSMRLFTEGDDETLRYSLSALGPTLVVSLVAAIVNSLAMLAFDGNNLNTALSTGIAGLFEGAGRNLGGVLLFELMVQLLWFFGIHGNNILEPVCQQLFTPAIEENQMLIEQGLEATEIYSKTFLDTFVNMGGSGGMMCLMIAVIFFSKRYSNRKLGITALVPGVFNISELITFGLPIVFNPIFIIPYLLVPIVLVLISTVAMETGLVPVAVNAVEWTTPVFLSGYLATGSVAGSVLQIVNLAVGVLIYIPFIKLYDREMMHDANHKMDKLVNLMKKSEETREPVKVLALRDESGMVARHLAEDLQAQLIDKKPVMFYQPQYNNSGECIGAEALMRWKHSVYGMIYPPLVIQVAQESGKLLQLEKKVFITVAESMPELISSLGKNTKISVNVTGTTIQSNEFEEFLINLNKDYPDCSSRIMIEITEQAALSIEDEFIERLNRIKKAGYRFAIDDFSMGSTSIKYLQTNIFSLVKLDGSMTRVILENDRSKEIIASITKLSQDLGIDTLAEYVETKEQRAVLESVGCCQYQGYLYSPAVPIEELNNRE